MPKVSNSNTRKRCQPRPNPTMKTNNWYLYIYVTYIHTHTYTHTHTHTHIYIYIHRHIHTFIYIYTYIYIYITTNLEHTPYAAPAPPLSTPNMQLLAGYLQLNIILTKLLKFHTRGIYEEMISWKNLLLVVLLL